MNHIFCQKKTRATINALYFQKIKKRFFLIIQIISVFLLFIQEKTKKQ